MENVFERLHDLGVGYSKYEHEPVKTCAESTALLPKDMPGVRTKHLFVRDRKRELYFLVVVEETKMVDLKALSEMLGVKSLGMASAEELSEYMDVEAGALSMLSLYNDKNNRVRLLLDKFMWEADAFDCHPNKPGIVLLINKADWIRIFEDMKISPEIVNIPAKQTSDSWQ